MLPVFASNRSSMTQTEEVLINKCVVYGKSVSTQTDYKVPNHITVATQTVKHFFDQDLGPVYNHDIGTKRAKIQDDKSGQNEDLICGSLKSNNETDSDIQDDIDAEADEENDSDPVYSPDFEECFESDHVIDDESGDETWTGGRKMKRKQMTLKQHQNNNINNSSVKDVVSSKLKKRNSKSATCEGFTEENNIKVNFVQIVDRNGEKKLQLVLTKPDFHDDGDTRRISHTLRNKTEFFMDNSPLKSNSKYSENTLTKTHFQTNNIETGLSKSLSKLNSDDKSTNIISQEKKKGIGVNTTKPITHDTQNAKLTSLIQNSKVGLSENNFPALSNSGSSKNTNLISLLQKNQNGVPVSRSTSKTNIDKNENTKLISLLHRNQNDNNKNVKLVSLLQKNKLGISESIVHKQSTDSIASVEIGDRVVVSLSESENLNETIACNPCNQKNGSSDLKRDDTKKLAPIDCQKQRSKFNLTNPSAKKDDLSPIGKQIMDIEGQVELQENDDSNIHKISSKIKQVESEVGIQNEVQIDSQTAQFEPRLGDQSQTQDYPETRIELQENDALNTNVLLNQTEQVESEVEIQREGQIKPQIVQIEPHCGGQCQLQAKHHFELEIRNQIKIGSRDHENRHTGAQIELQPTRDQAVLQGDNRINSEVRNQLDLQRESLDELQTGSNLDSQKEEKEGLQTEDKVELHQFELKTKTKEKNRVQLQLNHTELQEYVGQINLHANGQKELDAESQMKPQFCENEIFSRHDSNETTVQNNLQYMDYEEKENAFSQTNCIVDENNIIYTQDGNYILINQDVTGGYQNYEIIESAGIDGSILNLISVQEPIGIEIVNDTENEIIQYDANEFVHNYCKKTSTKSRQSRKKCGKNKSQSNFKSNDMDAQDDKSNDMDGQDDKSNDMDGQDDKSNDMDGQDEFSEIDSNGFLGNRESIKRQRKRKQYKRKQKEKFTKKKPMISQQCEFCGDCFLSESGLDVHLAKQHSEKRIWKCEICDRVYQKRKGLKIHAKSHIREPTYECSICTKKCLTLWRLKIHLQTHDKTKQFHCKHCGKAFKSQSSLKGHEIKHEISNDDLYIVPCQMCKKKFQNQKKLKLHIQRSHNEESTKFKCDMCEKFFSLKGNLDAHLRTHTKEKPFCCKFCTKSFSLKCTLVEHEKRHQGIKNFSCDECDMKFVNKGSLRIHKQSHLDIKKYRCEVCGLGLKTKTNLSIHMRIHSGVKPYSCSQCSKSFRTKYVLTKHMRSHTGEKLPPKFPCDICGKLFITSYNRKIHRMNHTGDKPFVCDPCGQKFSTQAFLNAHVKKCDTGNIKKRKKSVRKVEKPASTT